MRQRELRECDYPVLYLRGLRDRVVPHSVARRMGALNPAMVVADIDAPHLVLQAEPDKAFRRIEAFIDGMSAAAPSFQRGAPDCS